MDAKDKIVVNVVYVMAAGTGGLQAAAAYCTSAAVARKVVELFYTLNVGETPQARLSAAKLIAEAGRFAARKRMGRRMV